MQGWLHVKIRSTVNVRPRHHRYCVLVNGLLHTFKFQPGMDQLKEHSMQPVRSYSVQHVEGFPSRKNSFLVTAVLLSDTSVRILEVNTTSSELRDLWVAMLVESYTTRKKAAMLVPEVSEPVQQPPSVETSIKSPTKSPESGPQNENGSEQSNSIIQMGASIHRGLENSAGENNCFLNVIIQSFWHLTSMKKLLLKLSIQQQDTSEINVLSALKDPNSGDLHPGSLRKGLSDLYKVDKQFQLGSMGDAEETLVALLNLMHRQTVYMELKDDERLKMLDTPHMDRLRSDSMQQLGPSVFDPKSIPHIVFSHQIYDRTVCSACHQTSQWDLFSNLVFSVFALDLTNTLAQFSSMEETLWKLSQSSSVYGACTEPNCNGKLAVERVLRRFPKVFAMSLLWPTNNATKENLQPLLSIVRDRLDLAKAFSVRSKEKKEIEMGGKQTTYKFRGMVCYYGQHYFAFFYSTAHRQWMLFDDSKVTFVGAWENVVEKCLKGRYQPVLLFYELPDKRKDSSTSLFDDDVKPSGSVKGIKYSALKSVEEEDEEGMVKKLDSPEIKPLSDRAHVDNNKSIKETEGEAEASKTTSQSSSICSTERSSCDSTSSKFTDSSDNGSTGISIDTSLFSMKPVPNSVAMLPRTKSMNKPLLEGEYKVEFLESQRVLGLYLERLEGLLLVTQFPRGNDGEIFAAEKSGVIEPFDKILSCNGHPLGHYSVERAIQTLQAQSRPMVVRFKRTGFVKQLTDMGFSKDLSIQALRMCGLNIQSAANYCFEHS